LLAKCGGAHRNAASQHDARLEDPILSHLRGNVHSGKRWLRAAGAMPSRSFFPSAAARFHIAMFSSPGLRGAMRSVSCQPPPTHCHPALRCSRTWRSLTRVCTIRLPRSTAWPASATTAGFSGPIGCARLWSGTVH